MALIELTSIVKTYDLGHQKVHALRGIQAHIERNEFVAVIGQSGSGKSTLMNIVGCLDVPTTGRYRLAIPRNHGNAPHTTFFQFEQRGPRLAACLILESHPADALVATRHKYQAPALRSHIIQ